MDDERTARQLVQQRLENQREANVSQQQKTNLENIFSQLEEAGSLELNLLLKADVQGSVEALRNSLSQLGNEKISVRFLHTGLGNVTETDVVLASASNAIIIAFNVQADASTTSVSVTLPSPVCRKRTEIFSLPSCERELRRASTEP